ncbi:hypothetical protein PFTANZ_03301 [Plasmodium falciparum Tanzania (2000708)]|uniref:Uncharacterized protein n=1 Tax=Plasmodium falciparum Tanzania (2000708) TaxID=1036725 RepID=A0A024W645_PLAFA|nr:hypothetical protein PFTANZ_03301 [Plasmodium falciparum Tanzania (2000708)]
MGIGAVAKKNNNTPTVAKREFNKVEKSAESKKADKVVISIVGVRGINIPEITNGQIYFLCTAIFDNDDVKMSMEKSNHNTSLVLGEYIVSSYHVTFDEEDNFIRCYVSCIYVTESDGTRNMKLEGIGYTDAYVIKDCKVAYVYSSCKLIKAVGAPDTEGSIKMSVKCVDEKHPSIVKEERPFNALEELKKKIMV